MSTLENRQIKTTDKTYEIPDESYNYLDSDGVFDIDFSYLSDLTQIEYAGLTRIKTSESQTGTMGGFWYNFISLVIKEKHVRIYCRQMRGVSCFIVYT
ncbi:hypothetical protein FYJ63_01495 [Mobiluncus holmesii]|uniref:Uncharacterized protein n=1 Tax=Mobiluncus porci TaxID=2652278 RepID=A0A7K0K1L4_9ACTO|nr:hypothetical protein [Mobiluncus porci]